MSQLVGEMMKIHFILKLHDLSIPALAKWILSVCLNINYLQIRYDELPQGLHNEIARLKKLKKLDVFAGGASDLKEVRLIACRITTTLLTSS
jgi:hypothetical protein